MRSAVLKELSDTSFFNLAGDLRRSASCTLAELYSMEIAHGSSKVRLN
jgi:hypothetical protein